MEKIITEDIVNEGDEVRSKLPESKKLGFWMSWATGKGTTPERQLKELFS